MGAYPAGRMYRYVPGHGRGQRPPAKPGEYRLRTRWGRLLYIGETCNLCRRMREHLRSGKLPASGVFEYQIADPRSTSQSRRKHEREKIARHHPPLNRSAGGEGRIAGR